MDPNVSLIEALEIARYIDEHGAAATGDEEVERLAYRVLYLHEWLSAGGFLPQEWSNR